MVDDVNENEGPISAALFDTALLSAFKFFEIYRTKLEGAPGAEAFSDPDLVLKFLQHAWDDPDTNGDVSVEAIWTWIDSEDPDKGPAVVFLVADAIIAYATQAMRAEKQGDFVAGWKYAGEARYWEGVLNGIRMRKLLTPNEPSPVVEVENPAVLMALRRHATTASEKQRIIEHWRANIDPVLSAAKAATQIVRSGEFSLEFRTIQSVIAAAKKAQVSK
jgi:hypothetical protein